MDREDTQESKPHRKVFSVRLSADEKCRIDAMAGQYGFNSSGTYMRGASLREVRSTSDDRTVRQLTAAGNNLNQLVRLAHKEGLEDLEKDAQSAIIKLLDAVESIGGGDDHSQDS